MSRGGILLKIFYFSRNYGRNFNKLAYGVYNDTAFLTDGSLLKLKKTLSWQALKAILIKPISK